MSISGREQFAYDDHNTHFKFRHKFFFLIKKKTYITNTYTHYKLKPNPSNFSYGNVREEHQRGSFAPARRLHILRMVHVEVWSDMVEVFFQEFREVSSRARDQRQRNRPDQREGARAQSVQL